MYSDAPHYLIEYGNILHYKYNKKMLGAKERWKDLQKMNWKSV